MHTPFTPQTEIYLDANATTAVLPQARQAALQAMEADYGNPSSVHSTGLKARALIDAVRNRAKRLLNIGDGHLLFVSGATEGIQTAVLSALNALRERRERGEGIGPLLLYGASEHKAVPETLRHWNRLLGLNLELQAIPLDRTGRHDLDFLRKHAFQASMVCTMAANNETGVISDLNGIESVLMACRSKAFWMVDSVQALGKLPLRLAHSRVDYAPFSGHKLYAPKGIGLLYVRQGAPFTPLLAGGGQESSLRSGTENMSGIAALGAVLAALEDGQTFRDHNTLLHFRARLIEALQQAFPGLLFNAPLEYCLPTTLNFSVPGMSSKVLLDLFDAADVRVSAGSACSAAQAQPSHVLQAMGLPDWQTESAVRLSFGPAVNEQFIAEACARIAACGAALRRSCLGGEGKDPLARDGVVQLMVDGACCWLLADQASRRCVVIDPLPELVERVERYLRCQQFRVTAVLDTHGHADHQSARSQLLLKIADLLDEVECDALGWPRHGESVLLDDGQPVAALPLGRRLLARLPTPGHTADSVSYLFGQAQDGHLHAPQVKLVFCGDTVLAGAMGRSDFASSSSAALYHSLRRLAACIAPHSLLCSAHDYDQLFATTLATEQRQQPLLAQVLESRLDEAGFVRDKNELDHGIEMTEFQTLACGARRLPGVAPDVDLQGEQLQRFVRANPGARLIDVREPYEQLLSQTPRLEGCPVEGMPLSRLVNGLQDWLPDQQTPLIFFCRSGTRSMLAVQCLRRLGYRNSWHLAGGLALWVH